jgi:Alginate lyase
MLRHAARRSPARRVTANGTAPLSALALVLLLPTQFAAAPSPAPRTFLLDPSRLAAAQDAIARDDSYVSAAWAALKADADKALGVTRFSVVDKAVTPPSGDKHDYMTQAPYFWPDPAKPDGRPYIRKDGVRNPEIDKITDHHAVDGLVSSTQALALAYYFSGDERYAEKAASLLRAFFLDPATRMKPNLEYAQFIPGVNTGRGIGLIETRGFTRVADAIGLIEGSKAWTDDDDRGVKKWYSDFLEWMRTSRNGKDESAAKNNHGTYYDLQVAGYALFLDSAPLAKEVLEQAKQKRIAAQIEPDGRMPLELARTNAWSYSTGNLDGLTELATLGDRAGVDLWHFETPDGRSIRKAILYLVPFAFGDRKWQDQQINGFNGQALYGVLRRAAPHYKDDEFRRAVVRLPALPPADVLRLR